MEFDRKKKIIYVSLFELHQITGYTKRWLNDLSSKFGMPRISRGKYNLIDVFRWMLNYKDQQIDKAKKPNASLEESKRRKAQLQADMLELKLKVARGELIDINTIMQEFDDVHSAIRSILLGIPKHAARELGNKEIESYLDNFIHKTLDELSTIPNRINRFKELPRPIETIDGDIQTTTKDDDKSVGGSISNAKSGS